MAITKKDFKEQCNSQTYEGYSNGRKKRINAFFFDWKNGYKYRVSANVKDCPKAELLNIFYDWVSNGKAVPYYVDYKFAETDEKRFKVPLSL